MAQPPGKCVMRRRTVARECKNLTKTWSDLKQLNQSNLYSLLHKILCLGNGVKSFGIILNSLNVILFLSCSGLIASDTLIKADTQLCPGLYVFVFRLKCNFYLEKC